MFYGVDKNVRLWNQSRRTGKYSGKQGEDEGCNVFNEGEKREKEFHIVLFHSFSIYTKSNESLMFLYIDSVTTVTILYILIYYSLSYLYQTYNKNIS